MKISSLFTKFKQKPMSSTLIRNALLINEENFLADVFIQNGLIAQIGQSLDVQADDSIDAEEKYLMPGIIDDQVTLEKPGLTHKGELY